MAIVMPEGVYRETSTGWQWVCACTASGRGEHATRAGTERAHRWHIHHAHGGPCVTCVLDKGLDRCRHGIA